jgi:hypothetical protein
LGDEHRLKVATGSSTNSRFLPVATIYWAFG